MNQQEKKPCPNFPYFGASYPDAVCYEGSLHDLDDCPDEGGGFYLKEEDFPCPFCRPQEAYEYAAEPGDITEQEEGETDEAFDARMDARIRRNINALREKYGFPLFEFSPKSA